MRISKLAYLLLSSRSLMLVMYPPELAIISSTVSPASRTLLVLILREPVFTTDLWASDTLWRFRLLAVETDNGATGA